MNTKNEEIFKEKVKSAFDNHFDDIPYYEDMSFDEKIDLNNLIQKKKKRSYRFLKVAGLLFTFLITSSLFAVVITSGSVEAGKDKIWNFINSMSGQEHKVTDQEVSIVIEGIDDQSNIVKAKDIMPNLIISDSIFGGYKFDYMSVDKMNKDSIFAVGLYNKGDSILTYNQSIVDEDEASIGLEEATKQLNIDNGTLFLKQDVSGEKGINSATYIKGNNMVDVTGMIDLETLEKYMKEEIIPNI